MRIPLRSQFLLPTLATALAGLAAVGVIQWRLATDRTTEMVEQRLRGVTAVLAESNFPLTPTVLRQMGELASARFVLTDDAGRPVAGRVAAHAQPPALPTATTAAVALGHTLTLNDVTYFHSAVRLPQRRASRGATVLHVLLPRDSYRAAWRSAFLPPLVVGFALGGVLTLVIHLAADRVSRVLARLGRDVNRLADGDFSPLEMPSLNDETRDLATAVNQTATRLADFEQRLRAGERLRTVSMLGAGLAHELRNAVTGCRLAVDLHTESCPGQPDESLAVARRQLALMESRLRQLLHLGKQSDRAAETEIDLCELSRELLELIQPAARHAGVKATLQLPAEPALVRGDRQLLSQAIVNLLLNAQDAAAAAGTRGAPAAVHLSVAPEEGGWRLTVSDSGEGPAPDVSHELFDPFVTSKAEGVGLGLAVTRQIADALGGSITWRRVNEQTEFVLRLPAGGPEIAYA